MIAPAVKWAAAAWLALWLPLHLVAYPAWTLLWWCGHGSIIAVLGLCLESRLVVSWQAVALLVPQALYAAEALARLVTGVRGGGTSYLFDEAVPLHIRTLSLFHFVMPLLLLWAVRVLGYDRRALPLQVVTGTLVSLATLAVGPINLWCLPAAREHPAAALLLSPIVLWAPAHLLLRRQSLAARMGTPDPSSSGRDGSRPARPFQSRGRRSPPRPGAALPRPGDARGGARGHRRAGRPAG